VPSDNDNSPSPGCVAERRTGNAPVRSVDARSPTSTSLRAPAVLDPNVIISALLSCHGTPARLLRSWLGGAFELVVSDKLLAEFERARPNRKLRERIKRKEATELVDRLRRHGEMATDPLTRR